MSCFETFATKRRLHQRRSITAAALISFSLSTAPALAQFWGHYENAAHAYSIDIPPGFETSGENADGSGAMFYLLEAEQGFAVWGASAVGGVEAVAAAEADALSAQGWAITEQSRTPQWASVVAQRDHRLVVARTIALCAPDQYASFRMEFHIRDINPMGEILAGMANSFRPTGC